jgi:hypothetical protein
MCIAGVTAKEQYTGLRHLFHINPHDYNKNNRKNYPVVLKTYDLITDNTSYPEFLVTIGTSLKQFCTAESG